MEYRIRENPEELKGIVSNTHGFLSTYLDGGFKEKWNGYWSPPYKYLDYIGVKVNGEWLNPENLKETCYSDKISQRNELASLKIKQEFTTPENLAGVKAEFTVKNTTEEQKAVKLSVEPGVDIRHKNNDIGPRQYGIERGKNFLTAKTGEKQLSIRGKAFEFNEGSYVKEHYPGEKQVCLIPGEISTRIELEPGEANKREIIFETGGEAEGRVEAYENSLRNEKLGRGFNYAIENLENLIYRKNGTGIIAGHPWFQSYWARDSFWTALGMIDAGMFEEAEKVMENFAEQEEFPSRILTGGEAESDYPRCDSVPLFAIAVDKLDRFYGAEDLKSRAEELLAEERPKGRFVDHDPEGTWMDTLERSKAVDIQSLWIEALNRFDRGTKRLEKGLEEFKEKGYMRDNLGDDFQSINAAVPLMFGQLDESRAGEYLERINGEFASQYGVRTRSVADPGYNPSGYHAGSVWGLTTCWAAAANIEYGNPERGRHFLEKMNLFLDQEQLGAFPEVVDAETGESLGCDEQAWSAGLYIHVIDSYLLGMKEEDGKLVIDPVEGLDAERRGKRFQDGEVDVKVINGEAEVLNNPDFRVETR